MINNEQDKLASLTPQIQRIVCEKHTERPGTYSEYALNEGTYLCRRCGLALFRANCQFHSDVVGQVLMRRYFIACKNNQTRMGKELKSYV